MKKILLVLVGLVTLPALAQSQDSCNCRLNLDHIIERVSHNYAGFKDKVTPATALQYNQFTDSLKNAASATSSLKECYQLLNTYRLYFYDKHLQLSNTLPADTNSGKDPIYQPEQTPWTKQAAMAYFTKNSSLLNPIEGVWTIDGYEIGVMLNKRTTKYEGVIFSSSNNNWKEGMLKFRCKATAKNSYQADYRMRNFGSDTTVATVYKNFLEMERYGSWKKTFPTGKDTLTLTGYNTQYGGEVQWRMLNATTLYIRLKSCRMANKAVLDSLLRINAQKLTTIPNWIVDFRGNSGGSTDVYQGLLPFLYTKPMYEKGDTHWMTAGNTAAFKKFVAENKEMLDSGTYVYLDKMNRFGEAHPNEWYDSGMDSFVLKSVKPFPKRVAVLSDKNNGSSGETFLLVAKGISDKVTIFGENSAGYMDYGDLLDYTFPCDKFMMYIPSRRSNYLNEGTHYSYTGIPPDIFIPATTKEWIAFVFNYWNKKKQK